MGGLVGSAPSCCGSSLGPNPDISQKYKMGNISKGVAKKEGKSTYQLPIKSSQDAFDKRIIL
jgi:hypothetical protein